MTIAAILTDIEGTTSSIAFVKDVLFPYATQHLAGFLQEHWEEPAVASAIAMARDESGQPLNDPSAATALLRAWIAEDRKATALKTVQGMIWRRGYQEGAYRAHVYHDAARQLRRWHERGLPLYVYSSGSIAAQKLFFAHSQAGDMTPLFSGHFDTTSGSKKEAASYNAIVGHMGHPPERVLFLSDVEAELDAARQAGLHTTLLDRDNGTAKTTHPRVTSFDDIPV